MRNFGPMDINFIAANAIMNVIAADFPGGTQQFAEDGGRISLVPGERMTFIIHHPDFPEALRKKLVANEDPLGTTFMFVDTLNFEGMDQQDVQDHLQSVMPQIEEIGLDCAVTFTEVVALIQIIDQKPLMGRVKKLKALLKSVPGLIRGCLCYGKQVDWVTSERATGTVTLETPTRETIIQEDDILNLKIILEGSDEELWRMFDVQP